jgi:hypothetical protein
MLIFSIDISAVHELGGRGVGGWKKEYHQLSNRLVWIDSKRSPPASFQPLLIYSLNYLILRLRGEM